MSEPAAILATFAGFKQPVVGRRVVPLVFEVPIEQFQEALKALGTPDAANPTWCGIARTNLKPGATMAPVGMGDAVIRKEGPREAARPEAQPSPKPNSTRAVMMAKDAQFREYLTLERGWSCPDELHTDNAIKSICRVTSKSDLNDGEGSTRFGALCAAFNSWRRMVRP